MKCIQLCLLCADGLMLVGYSKIGYRYLFLPPACIRGPAFICPYRPHPRLLSEAQPLIESRSLIEDLRYYNISIVQDNDVGASLNIYITFFKYLFIYLLIAIYYYLAVAVSVHSNLSFLAV